MERSSQIELRDRLSKLRASLPCLPSVDHLLLQLAIDELELKLKELERQQAIRVLATARSAFDRYSPGARAAAASPPAAHPEEKAASPAELAGRASEIGFSHG